jgi:hypothetical protein
MRPETIAEESEISEQPEFNFYPNPATSELTIPEREGAQRQVRIMNSRGSEVFNGKITDGKIDLRALPAGIYTIQSVEKGKSVIKRFIKE